jgi:hypothetical protein
VRVAKSAFVKSVPAVPVGLRSGNDPVGSESVSPANGSFDVIDEMGRAILAHHPLGIANPIRCERGGTTSR